MADQTYYKVQRGEIVCDGMPATLAFISQNIEFFYHNLSKIREIMEAEDFFLFVSHENHWSFSCRVDKAELGQISTGAGVIQEGSAPPYKEIVDLLVDSDDPED